MPKTHLFLRLCGPCFETRGLDADACIADLAAQLSNVTVETGPCLGPCDAPVAIALQAQGAASYVFAGIDPVEDAPDILATCQAYRDAPAGWIEDARPCGRLRHCLRARVPAG